MLKIQCAKFVFLAQFKKETHLFLCANAKALQNLYIKNVSGHG
jgi:hypothetical protein